MIRQPPRSTLFPSTTLFRSLRERDDPLRVVYEPRLGLSAARNCGLAEVRSTVAVFLDEDRKSTRLNSSHSQISYAVFCLKRKNNLCQKRDTILIPAPHRRAR